MGGFVVHNERRGHHHAGLGLVIWLWLLQDGGEFRISSGGDNGIYRSAAASFRATAQLALFPLDTPNASLLVERTAEVRRAVGAALLRADVCEEAERTGGGRA